jgi:hypothetical protein
MTPREKDKPEGTRVTQFQIDLFQWFAEGTFCAALLFLAVYMRLFDWRRTVTGRALVTVAGSIAGTLLHFVIIFWGGPGFGHDTQWWQDALAWLSVVSLLGAGTGLVILTWQALLRHALESEKPWVTRLLRLLSRK